MTAKSGRTPSALVRRDWSESVVLLVCTLLFLSVPGRYTLGPPSVAIALLALLIACFAASVVLTIAGERRPARLVLAATATVVAVSIVLALIQIVYLVIYRAAEVDGIRLIETAVVIWIGDVIVFAIFYSLIGDTDFLFPQSPHPQHGAAKNFLDYVFLSFTTATAFSPTDTAPLTTRARVLMMVEAIVSLLTIAVAAARAINILPQNG